jgi:glycosyltransferase involved in cell wall biosynthesis
VKPRRFQRKQEFVRILIVTNNRGLVGGVETYLQALLPALDHRNHAVALLYHADASDGSTAIDCGVACSGSWSDADSNPDVLLRKVSDWNPSVVYLHDPPSLELHAMLLERFPVVMFAHSYYGACPTGQKMNAFPVPIPCARPCGPACLVLHYSRRCGGLSPITMIRGYRNEMGRKTLLRRHAAVVVASKHMRTEYLRQGVSPDRVHVAPLPPPRLQADPQPPVVRSQQGRLLFIGRLMRTKGTDYLIRALPEAQRRLPQALSLTVAGSGAEEKPLRELAQQLRLPVNFTGWLNTEERVRRMRDADLLVVPSLWPEPFGLVGIEAGCVGLPAVAYASGGIPDWLTPGESGELAPSSPPSVDGLADAIVRALQDPRHYQNLCRGAWKTAQRFTISSHLEDLLPVLEAAAQEGILSHAEAHTTTCSSL